MAQGIARFLDGEGRLKQLPAKQAARAEAFAYLSTKFDFDRTYTEHEVNAVLASWHTFGDYFVLRRGLVDGGRLCRLRDGSKYWRNPDDKPEQGPEEKPAEQGGDA